MQHNPCRNAFLAMRHGFSYFPSPIMGRKTSTAVLSEEGALCRQNNSIWAESPPCVGPPSDGAVVAVHGNLSHKADTPIQLLAEAASARALQVLSFDLPGHGGRKDEPAPCRIQVCVPELRAVMGYAKKRWAHVGLFACSLGACFSLAAYADEPLEQALFLSPVLDMRRLIENMMGWFGVTQERLCRERAIETPTGETLYWDYYCYVKEHPVRRWDTPTSILCGGRDRAV